MKDPNPMTEPKNSTFQCSAEDDCDDCVVMEYQWEKCIKDDNLWLRVIGAHNLYILKGFFTTALIAATFV